MLGMQEVGCGAEGSDAVPHRAGGTEVARILAERHGYTVVSLGDECRMAAALRGLRADRATLQRLGDELRGGDDAKLAKDAYEVALHLSGPVVIEGVRLRAEGEYLAARGAVGVRVAAPAVARSTRLMVRDGSDQVPPHRTESEVPQDEGALFGVFSVGVVGARHDPCQQNVGRRAQEGDVVELSVESALIGAAAAHKEMAGAVVGQQILEGILAPHPISRPVGQDDPSTPLVGVGVDDGVPSFAEHA